MKILVYGAGVLGSLYAARLRSSGHHLALLARGRRLADLQRYGLALENTTTGRKTFGLMNVVERLDPEDAYDLALVSVRRTQLAGVLPALAANRHIPSILFMICNAAGPEEMIATVGRGRVLLGYAGAGGIRSGPLICYTQVPSTLQKTVLGEVDGSVTPRLREIRKVFRKAGFPTALSSNIDAWLKTHVAWVSPVALAIYREDGDIRQLAGRSGTVRLMVRAMREGFRALRAQGIPVTGPLWVRLQARLPEALLVPLWQRALRTEMARVSLAAHVAAAREEMVRVAEDFRSLVAESGIVTPALADLSSAAAPGSPAFPEPS